MKKVAFIFILISFSSKAGNPPLIIFKENKGQWPEKVLFGTEIYNTKFYVNKNSFNYCVYNPEEYINGFGRHKPNGKETSVHGHNYEVAFAGADLSNTIKNNESPEYYNYFLGKDRSKWASNVKAYSNVLFKEIYSGIDLKLYSNSINLKYDFVIKPNANVNLIQLNFNYTDGVEIVNDELVIKTSVGNMIERAPFAYQIISGIKKQVKCKYTLLDKTTIGFIFPEGYNKKYELIIDPVVVVCSYSGATNYAFANNCTYDTNGNIYIAGEADIAYPTTLGAFQINYQSLQSTWGYMDVVVSAYNSNGSSKFFSTYLGGDYAEYPFDLLVKNNEVSIFGFTTSGTYPCTVNAFDTTINSTPGPSSNNNWDLFLTKLNMTGTALVASTYLGGSNNDYSNNFSANNLDWNAGEMECDDSGNVYVIGATTSTNFPVTAGVISTSLQGTSDAFVFKMNNSLSNLIWSTYLGGSTSESGVSLKLDGTGGVYCLGTTNSSNFPTTSGAYNTIKNGVGLTADQYISHINSTGTAFLASTYLGTSAQDEGNLLQLDRNNNVYLVGGCSVPSAFIPSPGVYSNPNGYNTIHKLNSSLTALAYKTKFGFPPPPISPAPSPFLAYNALKIDSCGRIYIAGHGSNLFPTTPNALQPSFGGGPTDLYIAQFNQDCASLAFASYFGGNSATTAGWFAGESTGLSDFDNKGFLYSGIGINGGLPTTPGAYAMTWVNTSTWIPCNDAFVKIDMQSHINASSSYGGNITGCPPFTPTFVSTTNTGTTYWNLGNGVTSTLDTVSTTYTNLGTYNVLLLVTDTTTCNRYDSIKSILNVINPTDFDLGEDIPTCLTTPAFIQSNISAVTYSWSNGQTLPNIYALPGTYTLTINNGGCNSSDEVNVVVGEKKLSERFPNVITPNGDKINDWIYFTNYDFEELEFIVYDRWGRERFKITNPYEKWEPTDLENGTYFYVANYKSSCIGKFATDKGFISVFK